MIYNYRYKRITDIIVKYKDNKICANGIFNKEEADSGIAIYFGSIVIKLLTMYSSN